jgi:anthranilate phosphoribosyltransferase
MEKANPDDLTGGDASANAAIVRRVLDGGRGAPRDVVLLNAGAALFVAGRAPSVAAGITLAAQAIDCGGARSTLERMVSSSQQQSAEVPA